MTADNENTKDSTPTDSSQEVRYSSGIKGLDQITHGGYIKGQSIVVRGTSGCGKTIVALFYALAVQAQEKSVFVSLDESPEALGCYTKKWKHASFDQIHFIDSRPLISDTVAGGGIELGGLLVRIKHAIEKTGAKRLVLDACDVLFQNYGENRKIKADLRQLFALCQELDVTVLLTIGDSKDYQEARAVIDYAADCVIHLYQSLNNGLMTRRLRILKMRGSEHGTNEYPFLLDRKGVSVMPVTDIGSDYPVSDKQLSTGLAELDSMLGGGLWEDCITLISGVSGSGKTSLSLSLAYGLCECGKRVFYCSYEEPKGQLLRNALSIGLDLNRFSDSGDMIIESRRSAEIGLEEHIIRVLDDIDEKKPDVVILDAISALKDLGDYWVVRSGLLRLCDALKKLGITVIMTELLEENSECGSTINISSIIDTWIRLNYFAQGCMFHRTIAVRKSRGSPASREIKAFIVSSEGVMIEAPSWLPPDTSGNAV